MAPAIAHFLVGAGLCLLLVTPIAYRYDLDHTLTPLLVPLGGIWGMGPDFHHIAPVYADQLYAFHNSAWADLFALHYLLDTPVVRAQYHASVFGSVLFFSLAVAVYSIALRMRSRRLPAAVATVAATGYGGALLSVVAFHGQRYEQFAAVVGSEGLLVGWLVLAAGCLGAGIALSVTHETLTFERLFRAIDRQTPTVPALASVPLGLVLWLGTSIAVPAWFRLVHDATAAVPWIEWVVLLWILGFTTVFSTVYGMLRVPPDAQRTLSLARSE